MKNNNIIQEKTSAFAIRIVNLYKYLISDNKKFVFSKQLLGSGTSIGANIEEAIGGVSDKDFLNKLGISFKDARERIYWLKLLSATGYITESKFQSNFIDAEEICKMLGKIQTTIIIRNSQFAIRNSQFAIRNSQFIINPK